MTGMFWGNKSFVPQRLVSEIGLQPRDWSGGSELALESEELGSQWSSSI